MRKQLVTRNDRTPVLNRAGRVSMLSLPEWLKPLQHAVSYDTDGIPVWSREPAIPLSLMPTGAQREEIERLIQERKRMLQPGPEELALEVLAKLFVCYATGQTSEAQTAVRTNVYLDALNDIPAWAIEEAVSRWFRGECGARNYEFAPPPAVLRSIATNCVAVMNGQQVFLRRVLAAKPLPAGQLTAPFAHAPHDSM